MLSITEFTVCVGNPHTKEVLYATTQWPTDKVVMYERGITLFALEAGYVELLDRPDSKWVNKPYAIWRGQTTVFVDDSDN